MATSAASTANRRKIPSHLAPKPIDYVLAVGATGILLAMSVALVRGFPEWSLISWPMTLHIVSLWIALVITPVMLIRARGDALHRLLGKIWVISLFFTALVSFLIPPLGTFSPIFVLSALTTWQSLYIWYTARQRNWQSHLRQVRILVGGGLVVAGFFTFQFGRLFDRWISGLAGA